MRSSEIISFSRGVRLPFTANLVAQYVDLNANPLSDDIEDTLTMWPLFRSNIDGSISLMTCAEKTSTTSVVIVSGVKPLFGTRTYTAVMGANSSPLPWIIEKRFFHTSIPRGFGVN